MGTSRQAFGFGRDPSGRYYVWLQYPGGGFGASRGCDGQDAVVSELSNCAATPVEVFETQYPWRVRRQELRTDSGGAGEFRGGLGQIKEYELIAEEAAVTTTVERTKFPPWGLFGGEPGGLTRYSIVDPDGVERILPGKSTDVALRCGSRLVLRTPGGGGYGDPRARDPEKLAADVRQGYVSEIAATRAYGLGESR
jgi:N-methylhydantoinase B/oxoprolinase/acetone carboxylase alpha subunit